MFFNILKKLYMSDYQADCQWMSDKIKVIKTSALV